MADSPRTRAASASDGDAPPTPKEAVAAVAETQAPEVDTFSQERLIEEADAFKLGAPSWVVAGALSTVKKKNLTVAEAQAAIKAFLATEVS